MINLHYFYYKKYFDGVDFRKVGNYDQQSKDAVGRANEQLTSAVKGLACSDLPFTHAVEMEVLYPGLITGVGIQHEASIEGEVKLGLDFDYTYGFPIVYGSSVKGVLKSFFEDVYSGSYDARKLSLDIFDQSVFKIGNNRSLFDADRNNVLFGHDQTDRHRGIKDRVLVVFFLRFRRVDDDQSLTVFIFNTGRLLCVKCCTDKVGTDADFTNKKRNFFFGRTYGRDPAAFADFIDLNDLILNGFINSDHMRFPFQKREPKSAPFPSAVLLFLHNRLHGSGFMVSPPKIAENYP